MSSRGTSSIQSLQCVAAVDSLSSVNSISASLKDLIPGGWSLEWCKKASHEELYRLPNTETPYGPVCRSTTVQGKSGEFEVYHVNPFSLLHLAVERSELFFRFLKLVIQRAPNGRVTIVYYLDKAVPGNNKRPDDARSSQCCYWTVLEFPAWFRSRRAGWIPFCYILIAEQKSVSLTDSMLVKFMLNTFDSAAADVNFTNGFLVQAANGERLKLQLNSHIVISDWDQHIKTFCRKGYNAKVPCDHCINVMGHCDFFRHDVLVHVHDPDYSKLIRHTPETFAEQVEKVVDAAVNRPSALDAEEKASGIKWDPDGLIFDADWLLKLRYPYCEIPDWMHHWVASGGLAQYHLNGMALYLTDTVPNLSLADIDTWVVSVRKPKGLTPISKKFFQTRIVQRAGAHVRAFGAEVLSAVVLLGFFIDAVVRDLVDTDPVGYAELQDRICGFDLLRVILTILQRGKLEDVQTYRDALSAHNPIYAKYYHLIPKLHGSVHIADLWEMWLALLSCWGPERHHRLMKRVMSFAYRRASRTALAYDVRNWLKYLDDPKLYMPIHLMGKSLAWNIQVAWPGLAHPVLCVARAATVQCEQGCLSKNDLVQYVHNGTQCMGFALGFAQTDSELVGHVAILSPCYPVAAGRWRRLDGALSIVTVASVVGSCPYIMRGDDIAPLVHPA